MAETERLNLNLTLLTEAEHEEIMGRLREVQRLAHTRALAAERLRRQLANLATTVNHGNRHLVVEVASKLSEAIDLYATTCRSREALAAAAQRPYFVPDPA